MITITEASFDDSANDTNHSDRSSIDKKSSFKRFSLLQRKTKSKGSCDVFLYYLVDTTHTVHVKYSPVDIINIFSEKLYCISAMERSKT